MEDIYQQRYLAHQERKAKLLYASQYGDIEYRKYTDKEKEVFFEILNNRVSQRTFNKIPVEIEPVLEAIKTIPSSCGRKGVSVRVLEDRDSKDLLSGL